MGVRVIHEGLWENIPGRGNRGTRPEARKGVVVSAALASALLNVRKNGYIQILFCDLLFTLTFFIIDIFKHRQR